MNSNGSNREFSPIETIPDGLKFFVTDDDLVEVDTYLEKNILFRVAASDMELNSKWKMYKREFKSMDIFFDTLYILSKDEKSIQLRVPLSCVLDYKGFRCLAIGVVALENISLKLGLNVDNKFISEDGIIKILNDAGSILGLKEVRCLFKGATLHDIIPISTHIKVHQYFKNENSDDGYRDSPTSKSKEHHFFELEYEIKKNQELDYVLNTKYMFPLDSDINETDIDFTKYLRPEFLCQYEKPLKADTKKPAPNNVENKFKEDQDILEINEASKALQQKIIPNLVNLLDSLTLMPLDSKSLSETFHSYGVNMRYLGRVALYSNLYHVQDICINEMIVRQLKQLLNSQISSSIKELKDEDTTSVDASTFRHPVVSKNVKGIMKKSSSGVDFKTSLKGMEKTVGFHENLHLNTSLDRPTVDKLESDAGYGSNLLVTDK